MELVLGSIQESMRHLGRASRDNTDLIRQLIQVAEQIAKTQDALAVQLAELIELHKNLPAPTVCLHEPKSSKFSEKTALHALKWGGGIGLIVYTLRGGDLLNLLEKLAPFVKLFG